MYSGLKLRKGWAIFAYGIFFLLICVLNARAQGTADIVGTVTDASGGVLPNATVTVKNTGTNATRSITTAASGDYSFTALPVGTYSVAVQASGFKMFSATNVTIAVGDHARVNAQMEVGSVTQTVEVQATTAATLQTDTSDVGGFITPQNVQDLPVNGRNFMNLVTLAPGTNSGPGVSQQAGNRVDDRRQTSAISANGQNLSSNNYLLDGLDNNERNIATIIVKPSIDAIQEVNVVTSMYGAQYGRAGGAVINLITKAGTNSLHGTAYEFLRNDMFDAKSYFNRPQAGNPLAGKKPEYRQNQFGGSLGGPIRKDKTFFFADYEGLRIIQGTTSQPAGSGIVPTACELGRAACPAGPQQLGNFSDLLPSVTIYNPSTHAAFPNNVINIPIDPIASAYASTLPTLLPASCNGTVCTFIAAFNKIQYAHTADARVDHHFSDADSLFARYSINNVFTYSPGALPPAQLDGITVFPEGTNGNAGTTSFPGEDNEQQQAVALSEVHVFRPNLLMQIGLQANRFAELSHGDNEGKNINTLLGMQNGNVPGINGTHGWLPFAFGGQYSQIGDAFAVPTGYYDTDFQLTGALTWTKGAHSIKFGTSFLVRRWSINSVLQPGNFTFSTAQTNSTAGLSGGVGGNSFASMLLGLPASINRNIPLIAPQYRANEYADYVQDDWRAAKNLTLNLGVRWDVFMPFTEKHNQLSNFDPSNPVILQGLHTLVANTPGVSKTVNYSAQLHDFQPRLGFAYTFGHSTVLRGGFGTSFYPQNTSSPALIKNQPFQYTYAPSTAAGTPTLTLQSLPPIVPQSTCLDTACGLVLPAGVSSVSTAAGTVTNGSSYGGFRWATTYMYNLQVEKQLGANVITIGYVGENGRHLGEPLAADTALPPNGPGVAPACVGIIQTRNPNPCQPYFNYLPLASGTSILITSGYSNYSSLQTQFLRRYHSGLTVAANYNYSSVLDNVGGSGGNCGTCGQVVNNLGRDYSRSDYDIRHRVTVTANYELPFGKSAAGALGQVEKGWQVNGIYVWSGGLPFSVTDSENIQGNAAGGYRVNLGTSQASFTKGLGEWFDTTAFRQQPIGTAGNEPRNLLFSPSFTKFDFSLFKDFQIKESLKLQFRAEVFNLFNTPAFAAPVGGMTGWVYGPNTTGPSAIGSACKPTGFSTTGVGGASATSTCIPSPANLFGQVTSTIASYSPRDFQFALKLIF